MIIFLDKYIKDLKINIWPFIIFDNNVTAKQCSAETIWKSIFKKSQFLNITCDNKYIYQLDWIKLFLPRRSTIFRFKTYLQIACLQTKTVSFLLFQRDGFKKNKNCWAVRKAGLTRFRNTWKLTQFFLNQSIIFLLCCSFL